MTKVGIVLLVIGGVASLLILTGSQPEALGNLMVPLWAWAGAAGAGALIIMFNRRPGN